MDGYGGRRGPLTGEDRVDRVMAAVRQQVGYIVPDTVLREYVQDALAELQTARVASFVPLLATRTVVERVQVSTRDWAQRQGAAGPGAQAILFVCVHNSGRSVMAEYLFNQLAAQAELIAHAQSAGTHPGTGVDPMVQAAMAELGLDVAAHRPRLLTEAMVQGAARLISMGCGVDTSSCPSSLIRGLEDWDLDDPHGKPLPAVRAIRDQVRARVATLVASLGPGARVAPLARS